MQCPIIANTFSIIPPKIDGYEPEKDLITDSSKIVTDINGNKTITIEYYKILTNEDLVFTSYTEGGINQYMIGNNSDTDGNGLIEKNIKSILYVPESYNNLPVTLISKKSFRNVNNIKRVNIPPSIKQIGHSAFTVCNGLEYAYVDAKIIGANDDYEVFTSSTLKKLILGENVEIMRNYAFANNNNLEDVIIYSSKVNLITIQFANCIKLSEIKLESEHIIYKTLYGVVYSKDGTVLYLYSEGKGGEFKIPNGVQTIVRYAFRHNSTLTKITIPVSVTVMEHASFYQMNINELTYLGTKEQFNSIGGEFRNCCSINTVHCTDGDLSL